MRKDSVLPSCRGDSDLEVLRLRKSYSWTSIGLSRSHALHFVLLSINHVAQVAGGKGEQQPRYSTPGGLQVLHAHIDRARRAKIENLLRD